MNQDIEIRVTPVTLPRIEWAARVALAALDDLPPPCTTRKLHQPSYQQRPYSEIAGLVHGLLSTIEGEGDQPTKPGVTDLASYPVELGELQ